MDKDQIIAAWIEQNKTLDKVEKAVEVVKGRRSALLKKLFESAGKGPYAVDGKSMTIVAKGETYFFMASKGGDGPKGPDPDALDNLVKAVTAPMASGEIAKKIGVEPGPKLAELIKSALEQGLITKTGERAQTRYLPKPS